MRPHLENGMPACSPNLEAHVNHLERIQRLATRLVTSIHHLPYEERLQWLGLHSLQRWRLRADLVTTFKIMTCLSDIDPNLFFSPSLSTRPNRASLQGTPRCELPPKERVTFSVRVVLYWNKLPASVVTAPSVNIFKKRLEKV